MSRCEALFRLTVGDRKSNMIIFKFINNRLAVAFIQSGAVSATMTPRRVGASLAVVEALIGMGMGARAMARSDARGAIVSLVLGPIGMVVGGLVVATAKGGVGTGNGVAGGVVAVLVGLIGMTLGGLALARSRRTDA